MFFKTVLDLIVLFLLILFIFYVCFIINWKQLVSECYNFNYIVSTNNLGTLNREDNKSISFNDEVYNNIFILSSSINQNSCNLIYLLKKHSNFRDFLFRISLKLILFLNFLVYFVLLVIKNSYYIKKMYSIKYIYNKKLKILDFDLDNITFNYVINKLIYLEEKEKYYNTNSDKNCSLSKFDIISRIMRKENYMNMLISNNVIDLKLRFTKSKNSYISLFSNYSVSLIENSIINNLFNYDNCNSNSTTINNNKNQRVVNLKEISSKYKDNIKLMIIKFALFELAFVIPHIIIKISMFLLKNAQNIVSKNIVSNVIDSNSLGLLDRTVDKKEIYNLKCYNELNDTFNLRVFNSCKNINTFINKYNSYLISFNKIAVLFSFVSILCGFILFLNFLISFINHDMLSILRIYNFNLIYVSIFLGLVITYCNNYNNSTYDTGVMNNLINSRNNFNNNFINSFSNNANESEPLQDKIKLFKAIINSLINGPSKWNSISTSFIIIYKEMLYVFPISLWNFFKEILTALMLPLIAYKLVQNVDKMIEYISINTYKISNIGDVCSYSAFEISDNDYFTNNIPSNNHTNCKAIISDKYIQLLDKSYNNKEYSIFRKQLNSLILYYVSYYIYILNKN